ncbi:MAG TPA: methyl-accepting chemotaxis protein [Ktedonobacteraceae bacterium]|nr:methyl-accepting chemotaxis protein [Ktedonobacteraceae bacterium]
MNDRNRGGMTISSLLMMGLIASVAIPIVCLVILGFAGSKAPTPFPLVVVLILVILAGGVIANYWVRRRIQDRLLSLVDVCRNFVGGDRSIRAVVSGDDEFAMLATSLNNLLDNQSFTPQASHIASTSSSTGDAAALQAQIEKLLQEVSAVGDGDLRVQAEVTPDTLGVLADSFNYMIEELAKVVGRVQNTAVQVTNASRRVLDRSAELAQASETQVARISQTTQAVEALANFVQNVAHNARLSAESAQDALKNAKTGQESVRQSIEGMILIRENVQETSKKIKRLGERSNEIGEIVRIIEDIADQTNLLALNAAIQSAMAGEHGRGFAVVADEIRLLAERSTESTKRIATLVKSIQGDTYEAVVAMEDSTQEVVKGSQLADEAGRALNSIYSAVERQARTIEAIAQAAHDQASVSEDVASAMSEISEITNRTNAGTQEAAMSVSYLSELSDQLRASVSTFRLPERVGEGAEAFPNMGGAMPALPTAPAPGESLYQPDMNLNNDWNQNFSSDFLSLPQPQAADAGSFQFAFNSQQDFISQSGLPQLPSGQQGYDSQPFGNFAQNFPSQPGFGDLGGFDMPSGFDSQPLGGVPESGYGNPNMPQFPGSNSMPPVAPPNFGLPQQNFGGPPPNFGAPQQGFGGPPPNFGAPQQGFGAPPPNFAPAPGNPAPARQRWPGQGAFNPEQVPFPGPGAGNGYKGQ